LAVLSLQVAKAVITSEINVLSCFEQITIAGRKGFARSVGKKEVRHQD